VLIVTASLGACSQTSASASDAAGVDASQDTTVPNACVTSGSVCKGGGVCGLGFTLDTFHLCASSVEVCCASTTVAGKDATVALESGPPGHDGGADAPMTTPHDGGQEASASHDSGAGHDAEHDSGHDAGHQEPDAGHDSGHEEHDAGHDAGMMTKDAGDDGGGDAKAG
jgi:hypothetical protein